MSIVKQELRAEKTRRCSKRLLETQDSSQPLRTRLEAGPSRRIRARDALRLFCCEEIPWHDAACHQPRRRREHPSCAPMFSSGETSPG